MTLGTAETRLQLDRGHRGSRSLAPQPWLLPPGIQQQKPAPSSCCGPGLYHLLVDMAQFYLLSKGPAGSPASVSQAVTGDQEPFLFLRVITELNKASAEGMTGLVPSTGRHLSASSSPQPSGHFLEGLGPRGRPKSCFCHFDDAGSVSPTAVSVPRVSLQGNRALLW